MNKLISALVAVALIACTPPAAGPNRGINLGTQKAAIALTSGSNNDVAIAVNGNTTTMLRFTVDAAGSTLSGMSSSTVEPGDLFLIRNDSSTGNLTITHGDTASLAANRFTTANGASMVLPPRTGAWVEFDATLKWNVLVAAAGSPVFSSPTMTTPTLTTTALAGVTTVAGHLKATASSVEPVLSSCGSTPSPTIVAGSTDVAGKFTTGGTDTDCVMTFNSTWTTAPTCIVATEGAATQPTYTTSATAITFTTNIASTTYNYLCMGR